ncbi:META domain-containing protein [Thalassobellus suaedae]|uniref:META domain-containing protein n=1 Tax=Thalassobellus suaedae TaxID=3074124 RepID=A0ABY9XR84_9FLAO|nr:META domain-containing protein [Flavobacteriaceae bacterium HL-DH14]
MNDNSEQEKQTELLSGSYTISSIESNRNLPDNLNITFDQNTNKVSGFTACNRFFGTYTIEKNSISISNLATTKMYCKNVMDIEKHLLKALSNIKTFSIKNNQINLNNGDAILIEASKDSLDSIQPENNYLIEYSASSRGFYKQITINKKNISILEQRAGTPTAFSLGEQNWKTLIKAISSINTKTIPNLEAPSKAFQYDGAAIARLKITDNGKTYQTQPFDHGNPPKEIANLVKEILSISENIE